MTKIEDRRIAVIGSTKMASVHAQNMYPTGGAELGRLAGGSCAEALASRYGAVSRDVDSAFSRRDIEAVVIASRTASFAAHIIQATAGGKAVLVGKSVDPDLERVITAPARSGTPSIG